MAKCANTKHRWIVMTMAGNGNKVFITCDLCSERFPFGIEQNGIRFTGKLPAKYLVDNA